MEQTTAEELKGLDQAIAEMEAAYANVPKVQDSEDFQWLITGSATAALDELHTKVLKVYELEKKIYLRSPLPENACTCDRRVKGLRERADEKALIKALNQGY